MNVQILGTRGIPSSHGGFETFAQDLALFLTDRGHRVTVYCQGSSTGKLHEERWKGIHLVHIPDFKGELGTIWFDLRSVLHSCGLPGVKLTLGYNTAALSVLYRICGMPSIMNMDGIEWSRQKWSWPAKAWLYLNEWLGARLSSHLIADHPEIGRHLERHTQAEKISVIPYGSQAVHEADTATLEKFNLKSRRYFLLIARPEPENSIAEIVSTYSSKTRSMPLVVLGKYTPDLLPYHRQVIDSAGPQVRFVGAVYDRKTVADLRYHAYAYFHGHRVGGTNPSLVESLGAGNLVIAHDNCFTRWVAGGGAAYFCSASDIERILGELEDQPHVVNEMRSASRRRHRDAFCLESVLLEYESLLARFWNSEQGVSEETGARPRSRLNVRERRLG